ncbi:NAD-dependent epimerase/dehydratase [Catenulispora acidiphila DSM 44928]|uniref:NAD-dependent epimerase/dehydratase n=1 Tax=Catenulispora acidiphila (strain DSM 44928 / JCM 14897 / NBRC 102108 / NRRL B-24433 / ID139908) TaxID=479433 RepID=C7Q0L5_CATAD|nr:NAD-dependent epimerase/dehydratase family protein [Catenulispora acidiphila]ACU69643.1 NAD-dependent epimerase/dehydratase [Catenulispora acidiphila DSM 44928]
MRVLVTGSAGFIGSHVVEALVAAGHEVEGLDLVDGEDVRDAADVRRALRGVDAVCHQAAKVGLDRTVGDAPDYVSHNDFGTSILLAAMAEAGVRALVFASSMVVYGEGRYECAEHGWVRPGPRREDDLIAGLFEPPCPTCALPLAPGLVGEDAPLDPRNVYAASKVMTEHLAASWVRLSDSVRAVGLRYHNVYGPRLPRDTPYAGVAALFRSALMRGEAPAVFEDGGQRRDFVHARDIATANVAALEWAANVDGREHGLSENGLSEMRVYNVGSGTPRTVGEMAAELARAMDGPAPVVTGGYRLGDVRHITASSARIRDELGWRPRVEFADGMAEFALTRSLA